jgi:hypothetical protein
MKIISGRIKPAVAYLSVSLLLLSAPVVFSGQTNKPKAAETSSSVPGVQCVIGLEGVKPGSKGTISVQGGALHFDQEKKKSEIGVPVPAILDIYLGNESRQDISGLGGTAVKAAIPYGGGRVLSLFSHKVEVMTVEYTDANGGFHGAIFVLPEGHATMLKNLLIAQGANTVAHAPEPEPPKEKKP